MVQIHNVHIFLWPAVLFIHLPCFSHMASFLSVHSIIAEINMLKPAAEMFLPSVAVFILHKNCTVGSLFLYVCLDLIVAWNSNCPPWEAVADRCLSTAQLIWIISLCSHCFLSLFVMQIIHQVCGYSHWHARVLSACYFAVISSCRHVETKLIKVDGYQCRPEEEPVSLFELPL